MNEMTSSNMRGWDGLAGVHFRSYHIQKLLGGEPLLCELIRKEVGEVGGKSLAHLLCHIGTDTLSWALLGARVTGFDISPESLKYARKLAEQMGIEADFIESDILEVIEKTDRKFDIVFSSTGVLCWLPDMSVYARTVRHLLADGGFCYILDGHPFRNVFIDENGEFQPINHPGGLFPKGSLALQRDGRLHRPAGIDRHSLLRMDLDDGRGGHRLLRSRAEDRVPARISAVFLQRLHAV